MPANCWLLRGVTGWKFHPGRISGRGQALQLSAGRHGAGGLLYGAGTSIDQAEQLTAKSVLPRIVNRVAYVPHYWSTDGYAALGVVNNSRANTLPVAFTTDGHKVYWASIGNFELYLMPSDSLREGTAAYFALTGAPRKPPLYTFGFIASRWGWNDRKYIASVLAQFRSGKFPIDAFICDFEFFTNESDYSFTPEGKSWYQDFGYHYSTFPEPSTQLSRYHEILHLHMGGIRKPRIGNAATLSSIKAKGWILPQGEPENYAGGRCLDFSRPDVREWYSRQLGQYLDDGIDFWWNDEGETDYFTYHWWNVAQVEAVRAKNENKRFYSLNRAFSPGMARLGATVWTGDVAASWTGLRRTPGMMLNWALGGAPYVACDIGGFSPKTSTELLVRWYQVGVFLPTMRVHSTIGVTPHFPWLWGEDAAVAMREALDLRYRLVPYHYSLAHSLFTEKTLGMRPLIMDYPEDEVAASMTSEWMDGDLLVAPVLQEDSRKDIYLPAGIWFPFRAGNYDAWVGAADSGNEGPYTGPRHLTGAQFPLQGLPVFARAGAVVPLAQAGLQYTGALPGGPLELQVYAGADGSFDLVEDDGETVAYESGQARVTRFTWDDARCTLSWSTSGHALSRTFTELQVRLFSAAGAMGEGAAYTPDVSFEASGSLRLFAWKVVSQAHVRVRESKDLQAKILKMYPPGETIRGTPDGRWLKLADEPGYIILEIGGSVLLTPLCGTQSVEEILATHRGGNPDITAKFGTLPSKEAWVAQETGPRSATRRWWPIALVATGAILGLVVLGRRSAKVRGPSQPTSRRSVSLRSKVEMVAADQSGPYSPLQTVPAAKQAGPALQDCQDC
jgi:alpha-glucosidase